MERRRETVTTMDETAPTTDGLDSVDPICAIHFVRFSSFFGSQSGTQLPSRPWPWPKINVLVYFSSSEGKPIENVKTSLLSMILAATSSVSSPKQ